MGNTYEPRGTVLQSQDYSCVAASCATALNLLGRPSSEAELAYLTDTRPGTGATVLRALRGLNERLDGGGLRARLYGIVAEAVPLIPLPALTALQYEPGRRHMVVILACDSERVWMIDPMFGVSETDHRSFAEVFTGQVIVFEGARDGGFSKRVLRQSGLISVPLPR